MSVNCPVLEGLVLAGLGFVPPVELGVLTKCASDCPNTPPSLKIGLKLLELLIGLASQFVLLELLAGSMGLASLDSVLDPTDHEFNW